MKDYNTDFALWAEEQAAKLRAGTVTELDRDNIAEELESLARALRDDLFDRLARLLQNLVQWDYLDGARLPAWYVAITEERGMIPAILRDAPSLQANWAKTFAEAWQEARGRTSGTTGLSERLFPRSCPYSPSQAFDAATNRKALHRWRALLHPPSGLPISAVLSQASKALRVVTSVL